VSAARRPAVPGPRDEVDTLVAAWRRERPDLDPSPLQVFSRVARLAVLADRERRAAFDAHALEPWEFDVLSALRREGAPYALSPGALLRATLVTSATMTHRVDRLAASGLVLRGPDPEDRRGVLVRLTDAGRVRVDAALADLVSAEEGLLSSLGASERSDLAGLLRRLLLPLEE
jgi:DNA-binding MarR family transcriptional regulator